MYRLSKHFGLIEQIIHIDRIYQYKSLNIINMYHSKILLLLKK